VFAQNPGKDVQIACQFIWGIARACQNHTDQGQGEDNMDNHNVSAVSASVNDHSEIPRIDEQELIKYLSCNN
jgi:hypothetical protein